MVRDPFNYSPDDQGKILVGLNAAFKENCKLNAQARDALSWASLIPITWAAREYINLIQGARNSLDKNSNQEKLKKTVDALKISLKEFSIHPIEKARVENYFERKSHSEETYISYERAASNLYFSDLISPSGLSEILAARLIKSRMEDLLGEIEQLETAEQKCRAARHEFILKLAKIWMDSSENEFPKSTSGPGMRFLQAALYPAMRAAGDSTKRGARRKSTSWEKSPISEEAILKTISKQ